jgi:putative cardiolipin synthase
MRLTVALLGALVAACASLPTQVERAPTTALANTDDTPLGRAVVARVSANPGKSGIYPLNSGVDAFAARIVLARAAQRSLDLQYYVWHGDTPGRLLAQAVWEAAERGVRVRILVDDANLAGLDRMFAALDAHPSIEVRLFNPFANRSFRLGDFISDFARVNRRMHNKSFTADNQVAIVGGRNVGDEYYGADPNIAFQDLDLLAAGPVVREVSVEFDLYWNSESAYPAAAVIPQVPLVEGTEELKRDWSKLYDDPGARRYVDAVRTTPLLTQLFAGELAMEWASARVVHDDPAKVRLPPERSDARMVPHLERAMGRPTRELDMVSPYFVPGEGGTEGLVALARQGVSVRVLTNSFAATDVRPVHAGYARYRPELVQGGVRMYELKPTAVGVNAQSKEHEAASAAALHAKTFAVDRARIFVGSFNLDPRSARLNTEMGIVVDSPTLATRLSTVFDTTIPRDALEVRPSPTGGLEWIDRTAEGERRYNTEPSVGFLDRLWLGLLSLLPIEWLL